MSAVRDLHERIQHGVRAGLLPAEWLELAERAVQEGDPEFLPEPVFCRTRNRSDRWCRDNFALYQENGLARINAQGKREWHPHAQPQVVGGDDLRAQIVSTFAKRN